MSTTPKKALTSYKSVAILGYMVILTCIIGTGIWAAIFRIDSAVISEATVSLESRRQLIQHLEGGIIKTIHVKEGQGVNEGDILFQLDQTQAFSVHHQLQTQVDLLLVQEARLIAERDRLENFEIPKDIKDRAKVPSVEKLINDQLSQFKERRQSLDAQVAILENRKKTLSQEIDGLKAELSSANKQLFFIDDELVGVRNLVAKQLMPKTRQSALEREKARLEGLIGRNTIDAAKAQNNIYEVSLQIIQLKQKFQEEVSTQILDTRQKLNEAREKFRVATDSLKRTSVLAPKAGRVQNVKVSTQGQVIRAGDILLELIPQDDQLIVEAHIQPTDVDKLNLNMIAEVRFPNFQSRTTPLIIGRLNSISRDRLIDELTKKPYFLAQISVRDTDIPGDLKARLRAGIPAEVIIPTGERTALEYLVQPLQDALRLTFREK